MKNERGCSIEGCDRPFQARDLCHSHYVMERRAGRLQPLPNTSHKMSDTDRSAGVGTCSICGPGVEVLGLSRSNDGYCALDQRTRRRKSKDKRRAALRKYHREYNFKRRLDLVRGLLDAAGWACEICAEPLDEASARIDHDHACCPTLRVQACGECYRGVLCNGCNSGLGSFRDDAFRLASAISYLRLSDQA